MNASPCSRCNTPTAPNALSISLDGDGMICTACSISAKAVQEKKGMRKAYITGAGVVGLFLLYLAARIFLRFGH